MRNLIEKFTSALALDCTRDLCPPLPYLPKDRRLESVECTETHFSVRPWTSLAQWLERKTALQRQIQIASGLYPYPQKCPLNAQIFDTCAFEDFAVSKFMIESHAGFFVTGNLFTPRGKTGPYPAIINPHGHWDAGRNEMSEVCSVPGRCANFAKMGFLAVDFDMIGYQDSRQVSHGFGQTPECQKWAISSFGLQLWNSIRVLDFLDSMPEVDSTRIGCTGASGGGTQTFMLAALDERIAVTAPVNMVGLVMQGGCACENAPLLRVQTNNLELAALTAPRPMLLIGSTGDWTCDLLDVDFPAIRDIYALYGAEDRLEKFFHDADHNYNFTARHPVYRFFARHLLGHDETWIEQAVPFTAENLRIFREDDRPRIGIQSNAEMAAWLRQERARTAARCLAENPDADSFYRTALSYILNLTNAPITAYDMCSYQIDDCIVEQGFLGTEHFGERIPCCSVCKMDQAPQRIVLRLHDKGKYTALSTIEAMRSDTLYVSIDPFLTGSYQQPWGKSGRNVPLADFFTAYNYTDDVLMSNDIWNAYRYLKARCGEIHIEAYGKTAELVCLLAAFIPEARDYLDVGCASLFVPCFESIGGVETCRQLAAKL